MFPCTSTCRSTCMSLTRACRPRTIAERTLPTVSPPTPAPCRRRSLLAVVLAPPPAETRRCETPVSPLLFRNPTERNLALREVRPTRRQRAIRSRELTRQLRRKPTMTACTASFSISTRPRPTTAHRSRRRRSRPHPIPEAHSDADSSSASPRASPRVPTKSFRSSMRAMPRPRLPGASRAAEGSDSRSVIATP